MVEKTKKQRKSTICEEDISTLLQRYPATKVLVLLQEVAQVPDVKIDWNELAKKTSSGISNAREYQMLWRHLAYRDTLADGLDDGDEPLDDDSDLDYELEAFPPVSGEASTEAAACVKVLIASGSQSDTNLPNGSTVEAPLTINIPNGHSYRAPSENSQLQGTNITVPVSVQKQPLPTVSSAEGFDANGLACSNLPPRRKRKPWSPEEDVELIAAVQKCGEGNWANILKGDFKGDRTASQLSQRWANIKKRQGHLNVGALGGGSQLSEAQLAARRAVSLALNMPMVDNLTAACSNAGTNSNTTSSCLTRPAAAEASSVGALSQHQFRQDLTLATSSKPRVTIKKLSSKPALSSDAMVKAAAVAAGARIATPSDAASLLKAAQAKNAVHIIPGGGSLIKSSLAGNAGALPPNVHFIRTGLATTPLSTYPAVPTAVSRPGGTHPALNYSPKTVAAPIAQLNSTSPESNPSAEVTNAVTSSPTGDLKTNDTTNSSSCNPPKEQFQEDRPAVSGREPRGQVCASQAVVSGGALDEKVQEDQELSVSRNSAKEHIQDRAPVLCNEPNEQRQDLTNLPSSKAVLKGRNNSIENPKCSSSSKTTGDDQKVVTGGEAAAQSEKRDHNKMIGMPVEEEGREKQSAVEKTCENLNPDGKQAGIPSTV